MPRTEVLSSPECRNALGLPEALSPSTIDVVKATAPVVAAHVLTITSTFYKKMFHENPETIPFFNKVNQLAGHQPQVLADAVVTYALNIDNLGALGGLVGKIAQRHVALAVLPEHYPIVHKNLMASIGEVLGSAVTPEVGAAWSEAVLFLAKVCIDAEEDLYKKVQQRAGGWRGQKEFKLVKKEQVARDTVAFSFASDDYDGPFEFDAGQYLSIRIPSLGAAAAPRHYTVTSKPGDKVLQCTVKCLQNGQMSSFMHNKLNVGDSVLLTAPCGVFVVQDVPKPKVLVSAGIGVTPAYSLLQQFGSGSVKAAFHVNKTACSHAYREQFLESGIHCAFHYTADGVRPDLAAELQNLMAMDGIGAEAEYYLCGPKGFMTSAQDVLAELGAQHVYSEVFGTGSLPSAAASKCPFAR